MYTYVACCKHGIFGPRLINQRDHREHRAQWPWQSIHLIGGVVLVVWYIPWYKCGRKLAWHITKAVLDVRIDY